MMSLAGTNSIILSIVFVYWVKYRANWYTISLLINYCQTISGKGGDGLKYHLLARLMGYFESFGHPCDK